MQPTATAEVDGERYAFIGLGGCQHTSDASIYEVPAAMWSARVDSPAGEIQYLNLTLWQPKASAEVQVSLGLTAGGRTHEIATVTRAPIRGRGRARVEPAASGGVLYVEGADAEGRQVRLRVDCTRFTEPVAEGG